nr:DUF452 family protein [Persicobacter sp. CCB-QB2]
MRRAHRTAALPDATAIGNRSTERAGRTTIRRPTKGEHPPVFRRAIITEQDLIIPTNNQHHYWQQFPQTEITTIPGAHYPFAAWENWEQLITLVTTVC